MKKVKRTTKAQAEPLRMDITFTPNRLDIATRILAGLAASEGRIVAKENLVQYALSLTDLLIAREREPHDAAA